MEAKDVSILKELLAAKDAFVSGNHLAERLGVSRVAIWSHMEKLRAQGFDFEAVRSKGYRLTKLPQTLNESLIQASMPRAASALTVIALEEIDSTNTEAERRLAQGDADPFVVFSRKQSKGRGRLGRQWHSPDSGNLYASFAFRPMLSPARLSTFTLWMGINICECINAYCRVQTKVKWPNDLLLNGRKLAGILTEARMDADETRELVLGVGLNVNGRSTDWPEELRPIATSLYEETGEERDINQLGAALSGRVMLAYEEFLSGNHRNALKERWPNYDALFEREVSLLQGEFRISGKAIGIDPNGSLILLRPDGSRFNVRAGEVALEKTPAK